MEQTIKRIKNYRSGVILILTAVAMNLIAGALQDVDQFSFPDLFFYIAFSGLMLVGYFVGRSANVFGLYMGLIPYVYSLIIVIFDFVNGNSETVSTAWSVLTVVWFSTACYAYAKLPKNIDLGETLPFKLKNQNMAGGHVGNLEVSHYEISYIEKGALKKDEERMREIAKKTKWRLTLLSVARWVTFLMLLEGIFYALYDYTSGWYMTYHVINLLTILTALIFSFYKPAFAFYLVLLKTLYFDMEYFVLGFGYNMYLIFVILLVVDILYFIFLYFVVWAEGTLPWAIHFRKTVKNLKRNKKLWRKQNWQVQDAPEKEDWLLNSIVLKDVFGNETNQEARLAALDL